MINHLSGKTQKYIKLTFRSNNDMHSVKSELLPIIKRNKAESKQQQAQEGFYQQD